MEQNCLLYRNALMETRPGQEASRSEQILEIVLVERHCKPENVHLVHGSRARGHSVKIYIHSDIGKCWMGDTPSTIMTTANCNFSFPYGQVPSCKKGQDKRRNNGLL